MSMSESGDEEESLNKFQTSYHIIQEEVQLLKNPNKPAPELQNLEEQTNRLLIPLEYINNVLNAEQFIEGFQNKETIDELQTKYEEALNNIDYLAKEVEDKTEEINVLKEDVEIYNSRKDSLQFSDEAEGRLRRSSTISKTYDTQHIQNLNEKNEKLFVTTEKLQGNLDEMLKKIHKLERDKDLLINERDVLNKENEIIKRKAIQIKKNLNREKDKETIIEHSNTEQQKYIGKVEYENLELKKEMKILERKKAVMEEKLKVMSSSVVRIKEDYKEKNSELNKNILERAVNNIEEKYQNDMQEMQSAMDKIVKENENLKKNNSIENSLSVASGLVAIESPRSQTISLYCRNQLVKETIALIPHNKKEEISPIGPKTLHRPAHSEESLFFTSPIVDGKGIGIRSPAVKAPKNMKSPRSIRRSKVNIKIDTEIPSRGSSIGGDKKEDDVFAVDANLANQLYFESRRKKLSDEWDLQMQPRRSSSLNGHEQPALFYNAYNNDERETKDTSRNHHPGRINSNKNQDIELRAINYKNEEEHLTPIISEKSVSSHIHTQNIIDEGDADEEGIWELLLKECNDI